MNLKLLLEKKPLLALLGAAVLGIGGVTTLLLANSSSPSQPNLITMLQDLGGTTGDMLANTKSLQGEVQQVQNKLGELNAQEAILKQQTETGAQLQQKLTEQEQLTSNGVALMEQILQREKTAVDTTSSLAQQAQNMTPDVQQNAATLHQLATALGTATDQSNKLNGQMDALLAELEKSKDSFTLFGTVNDILHGAGSNSNPLGNILGDPSSTHNSGPLGGLLGNSSSPPTGSLLDLLP